MINTSIRAIDAETITSCKGTMMNRLKLLAAVAAVAVSSAPAHAATIVSENFNTGFGSFSVNGSGVDRLAARPGYQICCGVTGSNAALDNPFVAFGSGEATNVGSLSTAFQTVLGQLYTLTFRAGAFGSGATNLTYSIGGVTNALALTAVNNADTTFQNFSFGFVGSGSQTTLSFSSAGTGSGVDAILDDVTVSSAVPEPATWAMMFLGFGMIGGAARYRRRKTNIAYA